MNFSKPIQTLIFLVNLILSAFIRCDDIPIYILLNGNNVYSNSVLQLDYFTSNSCNQSPCKNQFCTQVFEAQNMYSKIKLTSLIFPHFQVASVVDVGIVNGAQNASTKSIVQLNDEYSTGQYTNFIINDYSMYQVNAGCTINSSQLTYFYSAFSLLKTKNHQMSELVADFNPTLISYVYRFQINVNTCHPTCLECEGPTLNECISCSQIANFSAGQKGSCTCTDNSNYFLNGSCVNSCSTNYVPNGKYCYYNNGCNTHDPSNNGKCQTCQTGYFNNDGICQTQNNKPPGYEQQTGTSNFILRASQHTQNIQNIQYYLKAFTTYSFSDLEIINKGFQHNGGKPDSPKVTYCNGANILGGFMVGSKNTQISFPEIRISTQNYQIFFSVYLIDFDNNLTSQVKIQLSDGTQHINYNVSPQKSSGNYCGLDQLDTIDQFSYGENISASPSNVKVKNFVIINNSDVNYPSGAINNQGYLGIRDIIVIGFDCVDPNCIDCSPYFCISCAESFFLNNIQKCQNCISNCKKCSDNTSCSECLSGYYYDSIKKQCQRCSDSYCDKCSGPNTQDCSLCLQGSLKPYLKVDDNTCTECNQDGYYKQGTNCLKCIQNCKTCSNNTSCSQCYSGYYRDSNNLCSKCYDNFCDQCSGSNISDCILCLQSSTKPYLLVDNKSCTDCNLDGYFKQGIKCLKCIQNCKTCSNNTSCSQCYSGYYRDSNNLCSKCYDNFCDQCSGSNISDCILCLQSSTKPYLLVENKSCTDCNLEGYYKSSFECLKCSSNCKTCTDNLTCTKCQQGYYIETNKQCQKCYDSFCDSCSGSNISGCFLCQQNNLKPYLTDDQKSCSDCNLDGYYKNQTNCLKCINNCKVCSTKTTCDQCQPGYHIHELTQQCVICSDFTGYFISGNYCKQCHVACKECTGPTDYDCKICNQLYFQIDSITTHCMPCPNNIYLDSSKKNCEICNYQCSLCDSVSQNYSFLESNQIQNFNQQLCLVCKCEKCENYYMMFNQKQCSNSCSSIGNNYQYDSSTNSCICQPGYNYLVRNPYKNNFDCSNGSGYGYYCNQNNICLQCSQNCNTCTDGQTCIKCNEGSYLWQNFCYQNCIPDLNIIPNEKTGMCQCPEGYNLEQLNPPIQGQNKICQLPLVIEQINIYNQLIMSKDIDLPADFQYNLIVFTYNRNLTPQETKSFQFFIDKETLTLGNEYSIIQISVEGKNVKALVSSEQNRKVKQFLIIIQGSLVNYQIPSTILVSKSYGEQSNSSSKQITENLQSITQTFSSDENSVGGKIINILKQFQILCYLSNFVQVLPMIYLIRLYLPPKVNFATLFGATMVFNQTPPPTQIQFNSKYIDNSNSQQLKNTLSQFGLKKGIYSNFIQVQILVLISTLLIIYCMFFRKIFKGKQYTSIIKYTIFNFLCSYLQSSITAVVFSICYCWLCGENKFLLIFQISLYLIFYVILAGLVYLKSGQYLSQKVPNIFGDIDFRMKGSKSYILISFCKKYCIVILFLILFDQQLQCSITGSVVYGISGLYLLYYRFFKSNILTIIKVLQEIMISLLLILVGITTKEMQAFANQDIISNEQMHKTETLGSVILIVMIISLSLSTSLQLIRYVFLVQEMIHTYKKNQQEKQQKQLELEILLNQETFTQIKPRKNSTYVIFNSSNIIQQQRLSKHNIN